MDLSFSVFARILRKHITAQIRLRLIASMGNGPGFVPGVDPVIQQLGWKQESISCGKHCIFLFSVLCPTVDVCINLFHLKDQLEPLAFFQQRYHARIPKRMVYQNGLVFLNVKNQIQKQSGIEQKPSQQPLRQNARSDTGK